jgi:hypothetical protein
MSMARPNSVLQLIRRVLDDPRMTNTSDQELLQKYLASREQAAFSKHLMSVATGIVSYFASNASTIWRNCGRVRS